MVVTSSVGDMYLTAAGRGTTRVPFTLYKVTLVILIIFYRPHFLLVNTLQKSYSYFFILIFFYLPHFLLVYTLRKSYSYYFFYLM